MAAHPLAMPAVAQLSPRVWRFMGQNPGPMTLSGTCTYLVGAGKRRCLIDTGEGCPDYARVLSDGLQQASAVLGDTVQISDVLITHWHHDHVGGLAQVHATYPKALVHKAPTRVYDDASRLAQLCRPLRTGDTFSLPADGLPSTLRAIATPGHTDDHISVCLEEEEAVFTGDCILGAGSGVFASYTDFMASLGIVKSLRPKTLYPGHGPVVQDAAPYVEKYIAHRSRREAQILECLEGAGKSVNIDTIVEHIYVAEGTPTHLLPAASLNVSHQLKKLVREQRVKVSGAGAADFLAADDYAASAGASLITKALEAASYTMTVSRDDAQAPSGECSACEDAAEAGARLLALAKELQFSVPSLSTA